MIEEMKVSDIEEVLVIEKDLFGDHWSYDNFLYEIKDNEFATMYKLVLDEKIIGYVGYMRLYERAEITSIAVKREYQSKGYGKMLLEFVLDLAKKEGSEVISLEVRVDNKKALRLYEKYGFITMRKRSHYYSDGTDAFEMAKGV